VTKEQKKFMRAVKRATRYTDENFHTKALITIAKAVEYDEAVEQLERLHKEHIKAGHLTDGLRDIRNTVDKLVDARVMLKFGQWGVDLANGAR
jgi:hypothetical protein